MELLVLGPAAGACGAVCSRSVAAAMVVGERMLRLWCKSCRERERECGLEVLDGGTWRYGFGVGRAKQLGGRRLQNAALASVTPAQPVGGAGRGLVAAVSAAHEGRRRGRHLWQCRRRGLQRAEAAPAESARPIGTPAGGCLGGARRSLGSPEGGGGQWIGGGAAVVGRGFGRGTGWLGRSFFFFITTIY